MYLPLLHLCCCGYWTLSDIINVGPSVVQSLVAIVINNSSAVCSCFGGIDYISAELPIPSAPVNVPVFTKLRHGNNADK